MTKTYNLYNLEAPFEEYLVAGNQKPISVKNYLSDFRHFAGWVMSVGVGLSDPGEETSPLRGSINIKTVSEYKSYLESNNIPHKTINRRLSTIRKFCSFCISQGWMKENPAKKIGNIGTNIRTDLLEGPSLLKASESPKLNKISRLKSLFKNLINRLDPRLHGYYKQKKTVTIINEGGHGGPPLQGFQQYIAFLIILIFVSVMGAGIYNQFFVKNRASLAYPTAPTKAGRILSFQGRLTDTLSNPITTATNVVFQLYSVSSGGVALYNTGTCSVTPDQDGIFSSLIGSDCGSEIDASVFTENANVYLGVTVGGDAEMTPRQQIANVGYAINSETLQGLPPGSNVSNVPYINSQGNLLIAASNPSLASTYASSTFTISSAQATTIQSAGTGDIVLQATESGTLKFRTGGTTDANTRITVDNAGRVGVGTTSPGQELDVVGDVQFSGALMPNSTAGTSGQFLISSGAGVAPTWTSTVPASSVPFSGITSGTNTTAAMVVGAGATLDYTSTGTINASSLIGATWAAPGTIGSTTPNTGAFTTLSANSTGNALTLSGIGANIAFSGAGLAQITTAASQNLALMPGGNVGIGTTVPAATSILDLTSTTKGFLAPRMTTTQRDAITSPATGLMIYNTTTNAYNVYNGTTWGAVGGGGGGSWSDLTVPTGNLTLAMDADTTTFNWDTLTTGTGWTGASTSLSSGTLESLSVNSTAATGNTQKVLSLSTAGANATSTQTTYGLYATNTHTGTASTNVGGYFSASGGTNNYAAIFENGNVGIGTTSPSDLLHLVSSTAAKPILRIENTNADNNPGALYFIKDSASPLAADLLGQISFYGDDAAGTQNRFATIFSRSADVTDGSEDGSLHFKHLVAGTDTEVMTLTDGNVGIGTTSPGEKLDVVGQGSTGYIRFSAYDGGPLTRVELGVENWEGILNIYDSSNNKNVVLNGGGVSYINGGNVGIGTTDPLLDLDVRDGKIGIGYGDHIYAGIQSAPTAEGGDNTWAGGTAKLIGTGWNGTVNADFTEIYTPGSNRSTPVMTMLSNGNVGISTTNPDKKLSVWEGDGSIWDPTDLGTESLTNSNLTAGTSWTQTTDCVLAADAATCTFAAGTASTVQQASGTLAVAGVGSRWYKFVYTVSGLTGTPTASITTAFASTSTSLTLTAGTQTTYFKSATTPTDFIITTTLTAGQAFTLDTFSLKEVQGGDLALGGILTGGGTTGLKVLANGNVGIGTTGPTGKLDITDTSNTAASLSLTNNTATTIGVGIDTLGVLDLQSTSLTTGNFLNIEVNALTSGKGINLTSTSTGLTGDLVNFTASGSDAAVTGNVLKIGLTGALSTGTALNVTTAGASGYGLRVNDDGTYTDSTPFVVDYAGNVGIGTTSPGAKLDIGGATSTITNTSGDITIDSASNNISFSGDNLINITNGYFAGSVGIGTTGPDATSILDLTSTTKGFLAPRMDTTQRDAISTPATGLMIYNTTTNQYNVFNGTIWGAVGGGAWSDLTVPTANLTLAMDADTTTFNWDTLTTGTGWTGASTSLSSGTLESLSVNSTAATGNTQKVLSLSTAGANATSTQTTYGLYATNTHTGTASTNVGGYFSASGGTNNYAAIFENGNVGIGTTGPAYKLDVNGSVRGDIYYDSSSVSYYLDPANAGTSLNTAGDVVIAAGTGKLDVGTVDPPYTINGKKYATYLPSMTGVKEETTGVVKTKSHITNTNDQTNSNYQIPSYEINFNSQPEASDLWLFAKVTDLKKHIDQMTVLLTPSENTRSWYKIDKENYRLTIYSSRSTNISYRLTAPRFDSDKWANVRDQNDPVPGLVINDQGEVTNPSPSVAINKAKLSDQSDFIYNGNLDDFKQANSLYKLTGDFIEEFISINEALIARIKAGFIEAENIIVNNTLIAKNITVDNIQIAGKNINQLIDERINLIISTGLINQTPTSINSPLVETDKVVTNEIKPQGGDLVINLDKTSEVSPPPSADSLTSEVNTGNKGALARLIIKGLEGKTVTTIDAEGNASFSGQIIADSLKIDNDATISGNLVASDAQFDNVTMKQLNNEGDASISGKLIAGEIESSTINDIQSLLADIKNQPIPDPNYYQNLESSIQYSVSSMDEIQNTKYEILNTNNLVVTGNSNLYNVSVSNSLLVGTTLLDQNSIISLASELKLSALSTINLFDGAVIIAKDGKITTSGEIIAKGGIRTNEIKALTDTGRVVIDNLTTNNLAIADKYLEATTSASIIAAADNFDLNGIFAPAIETATASAGIAILPENSSEVIIYNNYVKDDSLIYLTPYGMGLINQAPTLIVGQKQDCVQQLNNETMKQCKKYFKVVTNTQSTLPTKFNWLIIN